jgi:UDP-glucose 4-epimerase
MDDRVSLVTGGAGFIGCHVARELASAGHRVVVLDDLSGGFADNVDPRCELVIGSITDADLVARLFREHRIRYVYHLAAYAAEGLSHFIRRFNYTNNLIGSVNLVNEAVRHDIECFVFTSSIAVYGANQLPMREEQEPRPEDPYGIAKAAVERDLQAAHEMFGLDSAVFRPHNVYGENQNIGDRYRNVVGIFMNQILQSQPMTIFGDGRQTRAFSYVSDVAPIMAEAIERPEAWNQVFNVGADEPYTLQELAHQVARAMNVPPDVVHLTPRHEVFHIHASHDKVRQVFGDRPTTPLDEGLRLMAEWVRQHGARTTRPFADIEIRKCLPPSWVEPESPE